ncbi:MAG: flavoprotein [Elusimicrobiota bacterium]
MAKKDGGPARTRRVVLGVSGSIAAYKACEVVRALTEGGAQVRCVMTPNALRFITPLTLSALSRNPVVSDLFDPGLWDMAHLSLAGWAQRIVIAPATAGLLSRLAAGSAQGVLESLILAARCPVALAPAMDTEMWEHPATRANVERLRGFGYSIWGPVDGPLASGRRGPGRMMEPAEIARLALH